MPSTRSRVTIIWISAKTLYSQISFPRHRVLALAVVCSIKVWFMRLSIIFVVDLFPSLIKNTIEHRHRQNLSYLKTYVWHLQHAMPSRPQQHAGVSASVHSNGFGGEGKLGKNAWFGGPSDGGEAGSSVDSFQRDGGPLMKLSHPTRRGQLRLVIFPS